MTGDDRIVWRTSSRSGNQGGGACVEVGFAPDGSRQIRDTKDRDAGTLSLTGSSFAAFLVAVKAGAFDLTNQ